LKQFDWQALLIDGFEPLRRAQRVFRRLPHGPRCRLCRTPFAGVGGKLVRVIGQRPSRKNPNLCQACFDRLPEGGLELDIGIVFADVRGSTALGESVSPTAFAGRLNRFYALASAALIAHDGLVDKLIGDEVMGLFLPGFVGPDYRRQAVLAALDLAAAVADLPVGVAVTAGTAFVGNVGVGTVTDFTALGDAVNVGARLQSHAAAGQVVLAADLYPLVADAYPGGRPEPIDVRGRDEPVSAVVLTP
jgi:adenylate cyclase